MRTTIDRAGRLVIPKALREQLGLVAGSDLEIHADGTSIRIDSVTTDNLVEVDGHLLVDGGAELTDDEIREIRLADQR